MATVERLPGIAARALRHAWRLVILVVGGTVLAIGVAMLILPGPAFVVIPIGLAILASEFVWAQRLLHKIKEQGQRMMGRKRAAR